MRFVAARETMLFADLTGSETCHVFEISSFVISPVHWSLRHIKASTIALC